MKCISPITMTFQTDSIDELHTAELLKISK